MRPKFGGRPPRFVQAPQIPAATLRWTDRYAQAGKRGTRQRARESSVVRDRGYASFPNVPGLTQASRFRTGALRATKTANRPQARPFQRSPPSTVVIQTGASGVAIPAETTHEAISRYCGRCTPCSPDSIGRSRHDSDGEATVASKEPSPDGFRLNSEPRAR